MKSLNLKPTRTALLLLLGFYAVCLLGTLFLPEGTADAVRVVLMEWGAFPLLSAIVGGVIAQQSGFLPLYGLGAGLLFIPFLFLFFEERNPYVILMYILFGYVGTLFGTFLYKKEVRRLENGEKEEKKKPLLLRLFDRYHIDQYK